MPGGSRLSNNQLIGIQSIISRATGFPYYLVVFQGSNLFVRALVGRACLVLAGLDVSYKPIVWRGFCCACPAYSPSAWHLRACPIQRLSLLPRTPILGSLLRECSGLRACSSWQPSWQTLERRGKRVLDSGAESFIELSWLVWDIKASWSSSRSRLVSPSSHWLTLRWFWSCVGRSGVRPQLGQAMVVRAFLWCSVAALSRSSGEVEAGARLASKGCGRRVILFVASGSGLVAVVVTTFSHDSASLLELSRCSVCHVASLVERYDTCLWLLVNLVLADCELW
ncbi:hypothetical protein Taro_053144 [Colocasia esculenta]|uniref:Uncharacterized protein n=1 Tax=Colocasia esculenta TaxID=4460 RepID=A0A843XKF4_COLES|nr:hypothetical protein [Colocasia esculenta]